MGMLLQIAPTILTIHSCWRWAVLLSGVVALTVAIMGLAGNRPFAPRGRMAGVFFVAALDLELLIGLALYACSPLVRTAWSNLAAAMKVQELRFFAVEHLTVMLVAVVLAHVGSVRTKRAATDSQRYRRMLVWYGASLVAILIGIPWWRPLLRGF
jgi:hypothetical protein